MLAKLPGWIVDDAASVRAEVAGWRDTTVAERWRRASGNPRRILDQVDPLPESTLSALARLRRAAGWGDGDR